MLGSSIKKGLVLTRLDTLVADIYHHSHIKIFSRLIPAPSYYSHQQERTIKRYGVKFRIKPADLMQWIMFSDSNDGHVKAAASVIKPGKGLILDVGSNIGHFSLLIAKYIINKGMDKSVMAFEPNPIIYKAFQENLQLNPSLLPIVKIHNIGIGQEEKKMTMHIPKRNSGAGTLLESYAHEPYDEFQISIRKLDDIIDEVVDFIKVDVENYEYYVFKGAEKIIAKYKPVIYFETNHLQYNQAGIFDMLTNYGYSFMLDSPAGLHTATAASIIGIESLLNVLAIPQTP